MLKIDLHMHTTCSDGEMTPDEIVQLGINQQLNIMSVADHDSLDASIEFEKNSLRASTNLLVGMEFVGAK